MKFLVDNQLPPALARAMHAQGYDAVHVLDLSLGQATDRVIWATAADEQRIVVSKDEDFFFLASLSEDAGRLLWLRINNTRKAQLLSIIIPRLEDIVGLFREGQRIVEIRA